MDNMFESIFVNSTTGSISVGEFFICMVAALITGLIIAVCYTFKNSYSKSFVVTLTLLPAIVASVILMVNGNIGAGVAVAGAFSLVRFRSAQGTAKEICAIFLAMAAGLSLGMGYIAYAISFAIIISLVNMMLNATSYGEKKRDFLEKNIKITIPEELDYTTVFNDIFDKYTDKCELTSVKTTNMGSMFRLSYNVVLKNAEAEKKFIDDLRCRNGNLEIICSKVEYHLLENL